MCSRTVAIAARRSSGRPARYSSTVVALLCMARAYQRAHARGIRNARPFIRARIRGHEEIEEVHRKPPSGAAQADLRRARGMEELRLRERAPAVRPGGPQAEALREPDRDG